MRSGGCYEPGVAPLNMALHRPVNGPVQLALERFYNYDRPHGAHRGKTPYEALREKLR